MSQGITLVDSRWTRRIRAGETPTKDELREHLLEVHHHNAGFTEACAIECQDEFGRNSYSMLLNAVRPEHDRTILDLACGSGILLELCQRRFGNTKHLIGVDMSGDELCLARRRLANRPVELFQSLAQDLHFIADGAIDSVLCHWALTLMDPVVPVLREVKRVLGKYGRFVAIVDGEIMSAPGYAELHTLIYNRVRREFPAYGNIDLGDARIRTTPTLVTLLQQEFVGADIQIEPRVVTLTGSPKLLARQVAGFFYASFVLSDSARVKMLADLENHFRQMPESERRYAMPINRILVSSP